MGRGRRESQSTAATIEGKKVQGTGRQRGRFRRTRTKATERKKIGDKQGGRERNRQFVSDSSLMQFLSTSSEEVERNSRWPWNSVARDPAAFAGAGQPVEPGGAGGAVSHSHVRAGWLAARLSAAAATADFGPGGCP